MSTKISVEQRARDLLESMGIEDAQERSAGDVAELADILNRYTHVRKLLRFAYVESEAQGHHLLGADWGDAAKRELDYEDVPAEAPAAGVAEIIIRSTEGAVLGRATGSYTVDAQGWACCQFSEGMKMTASGMYGSAALVIDGHESPARIRWNAGPTTADQAAPFSVSWRAD